MPNCVFELSPQCGPTAFSGFLGEAGRFGGVAGFSAAAPSAGGATDSGGSGLGGMKAPPFLGSSDGPATSPADSAATDLAPAPGPSPTAPAPAPPASTAGGRPPGSVS